MWELSASQSENIRVFVTPFTLSTFGVCLFVSRFFSACSFYITGSKPNLDKNSKGLKR